MKLAPWFRLSFVLLPSLVRASPPLLLPRTAEFSVHDALLILVQKNLYDLCAAYVHRPVYATAETSCTTSTVTRTRTISSPAATTTTETVTKGTAHAAVSTTVTVTTSSAFGTDTQYSFDYRTTTSRTTTTLPVRTIYTSTSHAHARRGVPTFPPPLPYFPHILSSACSTLLASHTSYATSTDLYTTTVTYTAPAGTSTVLTTRPATTVTSTSTITTTITSPYLAYATTTETFTLTSTTTSTKYLSTTRVAAQCAPTAYVINADFYTDGEGINFEVAPDQPDALGCCKYCISRPNCQAWVWVGDPLAPGACRVISGSAPNTCPAVSANSGFYPTCRAETSNDFNVGLGACASEIDLTQDGCVLGRNQ